jgi:hypothetical protein
VAVEGSGVGDVEIMRAGASDWRLKATLTGGSHLSAEKEKKEREKGVLRAEPAGWWIWAPG